MKTISDMHDSAVIYSENNIKRQNQSLFARRIRQSVSLSISRKTSQIPLVILEKYPQFSERFVIPDSIYSDHEKHE